MSVEQAMHDHFHAVLKKLDEVKAFALEGMHKIVGFVEKEAPIVEAGAAAVASAVPGVGPVVAVVEKIAGVALAGAETMAKVEACSCTCGTPHGPNGCTGPGCSCPATSSPAPGKP